MTKVRLPAVTIEVPRMGEVVYVHPVLYYGTRPGIQIAAIVAVAGSRQKELQTFKYECDSLKVAESTRDEWLKRIEGGPFMFIQHRV